MWLLIVIALSQEGTLHIASRDQMLPTEAMCRTQAESDRTRFFSEIKWLQFECVRYTLPSVGPRT